VVGVEAERLPVLLLLAEAEEALDRRVAVCPVLPGVRGAPLELGRFRRGAQRLAGGEQGFDVDPVVHGGAGDRHTRTPSSCR
jgi:hypothetical protein